MTKKTIVHVIDNLGRGGAETMLVSLLKDLNSVYNIVLVTLTDVSDFEDSKIICYKKYNLGFNHFYDLPSSVFKLRKIIRAHSPVIVRTQLFWSTIIGRIATPFNIPIVFSVHSKLSQDAFQNSRIAYWLEKITYKKRHTMIAVSDTVLHDYDSYIGVKGKNYVIHNFVDPLFFKKDYDFSQQDPSVLKLVAVGNLRDAKNYEFLLHAIELVKDNITISLDIIGEGVLRKPLQAIIEKKNLPVRLLGKKDNVHELLPQYNLYIMCSHYEGFGNGPVEAMAIGLPLILNDLDTMKEMSKDNALFFETNTVHLLADLLCSLQHKQNILSGLSENGKTIALEYYTKEKYFNRLKEVYNECIVKPLLLNLPRQGSNPLNNISIILKQFN